MELTQDQYERIEHCFPKPRGTLRYSHLEVLNAILYVAENGAKWRKLPASLGHWHTVYTRMRAWTKNGVLARVFEALQQEQLIHFKIEVGSLDGTSIKVRPDGTGALKKTGRKPWEYDRGLYKRRNEVERLFRGLKGFRRIFSRFEKLDAMFTAFIHIALIFDALLYLNTT